MELRNPTQNECKKTVTYLRGDPKIRTDSAILYRDRDLDSMPVAQLAPGMVVTLSARETRKGVAWVRAETAEGKRGFLLDDVEYLSVGKHVLDQETAPVHEKPALDSPDTRTIQREEVFYIEDVTTNEHGSWLRIRDSSGNLGFASAAISRRPVSDPPSGFQPMKVLMVMLTVPPALVISLLLGYIAVPLSILAATACAALFLRLTYQWVHQPVGFLWLLAFASLPVMFFPVTLVIWVQVCFMGAAFVGWLFIVVPMTDPDIS